MRLFLLSLLFSLVIAVRLDIYSTAVSLDQLLRDARCESYCFIQCHKIRFENIATNFCESCKSKCEEARTTASRKKIQAFLTPTLKVSDRSRGEIELDLTLSSTCEQCLVVLEYRFMAGDTNTVSKWVPFQIVTPGIYTYQNLPLDTAYQFRTHLIHLWQSKKVAITQWADLSLDL